MTVTLLDHINIVTDRLAETRDFFINVLGMEEGNRPDFKFPGHWLYVGGRALVHLVGVDDARRASSEVALDHFAFAASDYDETLARLTGHGVDYVANDIADAGIRQLFIRDPNGVTIELNFRGD